MTERQLLVAGHDSPIALSPAGRARVRPLVATAGELVIAVPIAFLILVTILAMRVILIMSETAGRPAPTSESARPERPQDDQFDRAAFGPRAAPVESPEARTVRDAQLHEASSN